MPIHPRTIYTKTPKGVMEVKNKTAKLPRDVGLVFLSVDGKSTVADLARKAGMEEKKLHEVLEKLTTDGFVRVFSSPDTAKPAGAAVPAPAAVSDDLDFTSPAAMAKLNVEASVRTKAEAEAKARALAAARAAAEAKVRQEAETRARTAAEAKMKAESEGKARAEAAAKAAIAARAKAEAESKAAAGAQAKAEAEARIKAAMEARARAEAEARAREEAEMRAKAEAEAKAASEARAKEEAQARARAEIDARAHAEAEAKAKSAVEAQMKALQDALSQAEQRAKHEAAERARMEVEIKARADAEAKARAEVEARAKSAEEAVNQARAMAEEAARAKAAAETKAALESVGGNEAARAHMESAMKALEEAKAKARAESDARVEAERRVKSEAEAREREEKERAERELKERKEREEAEARVKLQLLELQEQARRAKEEAEASARSERKAREEAEAKVEAERKAREAAEAKAAAEARSREEALAKARIEAETKARAEVEGMIQAERKAREEAERRAQMEIAAKVASEKKAREEAERQAEIARKAREEVERKAREMAQAGNAQIAQKARAEAEAIARKAEEAVAQARAQAEVERKARAEAEERAKTEAVARVMQEQQLRSHAEEDIKARVQEELKAREVAEREAEARYRQEAAARAKAAAAERRQRDEDTKSKKGPVKVLRPTNWPKAIGIAVVVLLAAAIGLLHVMPLNNFIGGARELMSKRLGVPVTIANLRYALLPTPQLTLERVGIGKLQEIKIDTIAVSAWPMTLLGEGKRFDNVVANSVSAGQEGLAMVRAWGGPGDTQALSVRRLQLRGVKLALKAIEVPPFGAEITFGPDGAMQSATLSEGNVRVVLAPRDKAMRVELDARDWSLPIGPSVRFDELTLQGVIDAGQAEITAINGRFGRGAVKGSARADWTGSNIRMEGDFSVTNGELGVLMAEFTRDFTATGWLNANVTYALQGATLQTLFANPRVEATFNIEKGSLNNVDVVRAIQNPSRDGMRGGKTAFNSLAGSMQLANRNYSYRQLQLASGPMNASGNVNVAPEGELSGRINVQLGSRTVIVARGNLAVTGNLKTPILK